MASVEDFLAAHRVGALVALSTSGTTQAPRRVLRTTASWVDSFPVVASLTGLTPSSRVWVPGPLSATMNLFGAVHARVAGAVLVDDVADATHAQLTPAALTRTLDQGSPLSGVVVVVAGDRLAPALHARATAAGARVHHYYGAAELSFVAWGAHAEDLEPFPDVAVEVRDGEVWARTPYLCSGYDGPLGPLRVDPDGWATVGDRGELLGRRLRPLGRPHTVTVGGETVDTVEVARTLRVEADGDVHVVGRRHPVLGELLVAVLTDARDHRRLLELARTRLHGAARPRMWLHVDPLPETPAGKVDHAALRQLVATDDPAVTRLV